MNNSPQHDDKPEDQAPAWITAARAELEHSSAALDAVTLARLRSARLRALQAEPDRLAWTRWPAMASVGLVLVLAVTVISLQQAAVTSEREVAEQMSAVDEGFDLYENLEFYEWLEGQGDEDKRNG